MQHRFVAAVHMEITVWWDQGRGSFMATGHTRSGDVKWEIGDEGSYPDLLTFKAALRVKGVSLAATDANRLLENQEAHQAAAARAAARTTTSA